MAGQQAWAHCHQHDCSFWDCRNQPHGRGAFNPALDWYTRFAPRAIVRDAERLAFCFGGPPSVWLPRMEHLPDSFKRAAANDPEVRDLIEQDAAIVFWVPTNNDPNTWELPA